MQLRAWKREKKRQQKTTSDAKVVTHHLPKETDAQPVSKQCLPWKTKFPTPFVPTPVLLLSMIF